MAKGLKYWLARKSLDKIAGPLDEIAQALGVPVDDIVEALVDTKKKSGVKTVSGESVEDAQKRIAKFGGAGTPQRIMTAIGEYAVPETLEGLGNIKKNKYDTLSRIMASISSRNARQRELFGPSLADMQLDAMRAQAERKGSDTKEIMQRVANITKGISAYNRKEDEKIRTMQAAVDPAFEGRTGLMREERMLNKDADRISRGD